MRLVLLVFVVMATISVPSHSAKVDVQQELLPAVGVQEAIPAAFVEVQSVQQAAPSAKSDVVAQVDWLVAKAPQAINRAMRGVAKAAESVQNAGKIRKMPVLPTLSFGVRRTVAKQESLPNAEIVDQPLEPLPELLDKQEPVLSNETF